LKQQQSIKEEHRETIEGLDFDFHAAAALNVIRLGLYLEAKVQEVSN
jgi:hypothetical protein